MKRKIPKGMLIPFEVSSILSSLDREVTIYFYEMLDGLSNVAMSQRKHRILNSRNGSCIEEDSRRLINLSIAMVLFNVCIDIHRALDKRDGGRDD